MATLRIVARASLLLILTMSAIGWVGAKGKASTKSIAQNNSKVIEVDYPLMYVRSKLPYQTIYQKAPKGQSKMIVPVQAGRVGEHYKCYVLMGKSLNSEKVLVHERKAPPRDAIYSVKSRLSEPRVLASRSGMYDRSRCIVMMATAYDPSPASCGRGATGRTANGMKAGYGVVAVDPRIIRLGTHLYIDGYGYAIAGDTGGAIKGRRIDLGYNTNRDAHRFGRKRVRVYVLN
ncbi:MAG: 3D domain-containing protein [bacterium]